MIDAARTRGAFGAPALAAAAALTLWLGGAADGRANADGSASPAPPQTAIEASVRAAIDVERGELARTSPGASLARAQARAGARLADLGPAATPALAAALAREESEAVAGAIALGLLAFPGAVPAPPLVEALERRGVGALPALVRATGRFGGEAGAGLVVSLLAESDAEVTKLAQQRTPEARKRLQELRTFRDAAVDALGESAATPSLEKLFSMLGPASAPVAGGGVAGPDPDRVRRAAGVALKRAVGGAADPADIDRTLGEALARSRGPLLAAMLEAAGGIRLPCLVPASRRALEEALDLPAGTPDRTAMRRAAAAALRPFAIGRDGPADRAALTLYLGLLDAADDEALRLGVAIDLGRSNHLLAVPRLIDVYERDASIAVRKQAHASLVRLASGENVGDPGAWREWYGRQP